MGRLSVCSGIEATSVYRPDPVEKLELAQEGCTLQGYAASAPKASGIYEGRRREKEVPTLDSWGLSHSWIFAPPDNPDTALTADFRSVIPNGARADSKGSVH